MKNRALSFRLLWHKHNKKLFCCVFFINVFCFAVGCRCVCGHAPCPRERSTSSSRVRSSVDSVYTRVLFSPRCCVLMLWLVGAGWVNINYINESVISTAVMRRNPCTYTHREPTGRRLRWGAGGAKIFVVFARSWASLRVANDQWTRGAGEELKRERSVPSFVKKASGRIISCFTKEKPGGCYLSVVLRLHVGLLLPDLQASVSNLLFQSATFFLSLPLPVTFFLFFWVSSPPSSSLLWCESRDLE